MSEQYQAPADGISAAPASPAVMPAVTGETEIERRRRHSRRVRLYVYSLLLVALLIILIALVAANTRQVELSWVVGSGSASLVWIVVGGAVVGWLLGLLTSIMFRARTRAPHA